jgi:hypothetical protein
MRAVAGSVSAGTRQRAKQEHQTPVSPPLPSGLEQHHGLLEVRCLEACGVPASDRGARRLGGEGSALKHNWAIGHCGVRSHGRWKPPGFPELVPQLLIRCRGATDYLRRLGGV